MLLHCVNDAERIGDHALIVRDIFNSLREGEAALSDDARGEFLKLHAKLVKQAQGTLSLLAGADDSVRRAVMTLRDEIMVTAALFEQNHMIRLREKRCSTESSIVYLELLGEFRKVSRHLANIAERSGAFRAKAQTAPGY
jgi:phosphate:Na+ symporter